MSETRESGLYIYAAAASLSGDSWNVWPLATSQCNAGLGCQRIWDTMGWQLSFHLWFWSSSHLLYRTPCRSALARWCQASTAERDREAMSSLSSQLLRVWKLSFKFASRLPLYMRTCPGSRLHCNTVQVLSDPSAYGFSNASSCHQSLEAGVRYPAGIECSEPAQHFLWDEVKLLFALLDPFHWQTSIFPHGKLFWSVTSCANAERYWGQKEQLLAVSFIPECLLMYQLPSLTRLFSFSRYNQQQLLMPT